jgi:CBS domain-containing protein
VVTAYEDESVDEGLEPLGKHRIPCLAVGRRSDDRVLGILTQEDLVRALERGKPKGEAA